MDGHAAAPADAPTRTRRKAGAKPPAPEDPVVQNQKGDTGGIAGAKLKSFVERIERLETEKADLSADVKSVYDEARGNGFDVKIIRQVIKLRKMEEPDRKEQDELLDLYRAALEV